MSDDYPLGADSDTDAMLAWVDDAADCPPMPRKYESVPVTIHYPDSSPHRGDRAADHGPGGGAPTSPDH